MTPPAPSPSRSDCLVLAGSERGKRTGFAASGLCAPPPDTDGSTVALGGQPPAVTRLSGGVTSGARAAKPPPAAR